MKKMQLQKVSIVLLAILLAAIAMVPMVSAGEQSDKTFSSDTFDSALTEEDVISQNYISETTARDHAIIKTTEFVIVGLLDDNWEGIRISPDSGIIYDLNGKKLFYQFSVEKDGKRIGDVLTPASKVLGIPVQLISEPNRYDLNSVQIQVRDLAAKEFEGFTVKSSKMVSYSYPKMGVMVHLVNLLTLEQKDVIYDANYLTIVPEKKVTEDSESETWSYYQQIPVESYNERIAHWDTEDQQMSIIKEKASSAGLDMSRYLSRESIQSLSPLVLGETKGVFEYGELPSGFPTIDQGQAEWCQVATAWVITKFHYPSNTRTLTNIATTMNIPDIYHGATWYNELAYYTSDYLSGAANGGLGMDGSYYRTTNPSLTYEKVKSEIDVYERPLKVGYNGHSRACIGYSRNPAGDTYYKFSNSWGGVLQWEAAPNLYGSVTGYNDYIIVE